MRVPNNIGSRGRYQNSIGREKFDILGLMEIIFIILYTTKYGKLYNNITGSKWKQYIILLIKKQLRS